MAFRDKYTDFTFDDKKSSSYKVWITNKNDLQLALTPNFKDKFTSPQFGGVRYLDGTTIEKTDIKVSCIAIDVTLNEWRAICNWLSPTKIGKLSFDFNNYTYYTVKLSSAVTAKMFNYGGKDSVIGGRKVIEFDLSFTTVGDYAAIGAINTAHIGVENTSSATLNDKMLELVTRSTNAFRMPNIYSDCTYLETMDESYNSVTNLVTGLELILDDNLGELQWVNTDGVNYSLQKSGTIWNYQIYKDASTVYYSATHKDNTILVHDQLAKLTTAKNTSASAGQDVYIATQNLNIFNTGEYEMYPRIYLNNITRNFEVWLDDVLYYRYELAGARTSHNALNNVVIDCQSGTVTYNGRFMENASDAYGYTITASSFNLGPMSIPTGEPEIHLAKFVSVYNDVTTGLEGLKFILAEPTINNFHDSINLGVCVTKDINTTRVYGSGRYGDSDYYYEPHFKVGSTYYMDVHSYIKEYDSSDPRKVIIYTTPNSFGGCRVLNAAGTDQEWASLTWGDSQKDNLYYISFCKGHRLTIKVDGNIPENSFVSTQTRGAI